MRFFASLYAQAFYDVIKDEKDIKCFNQKCQNFIHLINSRHHFKNIYKIVNSLIDIINKEQKIFCASITSAFDISQNKPLLSQITNFLKKQYNFDQIQFTFKRNPNLISGFLVHANDEVINFSLKKQIINLEKSLKEI